MKLKYRKTSSSPVRSSFDHFILPSIPIFLSLSPFVSAPSTSSSSSPNVHPSSHLFVVLLPPCPPFVHPGSLSAPPIPTASNASSTMQPFCRFPFEPRLTLRRNLRPTPPVSLLSCRRVPVPSLSCTPPSLLSHRQLNTLARCSVPSRVHQLTRRTSVST